MVVSGSGGSIRAGSRTVAAIRAWTLSRDDAEMYEVRAEVSDVQSVWWDHGGPYTVAVAIGARRWCWDVPALPPVAAIVSVPCSGPPLTR